METMTFEEFVAAVEKITGAMPLEGGTSSHTAKSVARRAAYAARKLSELHPDKK